MNIFYSIGLMVAGLGTFIIIVLIAEHFRKTKEVEKDDNKYEYFKQIFLDNEKEINNEYNKVTKKYENIPSINDICSIYAIVSLLDINSNTYKKTIIKTSKISFTKSSIIINYEMDVSHHIFRGSKIETFTFDMPFSEYNNSWFTNKQVAAYHFLQSIKRNEKIEYKTDLL